MEQSRPAGSLTVRRRLSLRSIVYALMLVLVLLSQTLVDWSAVPLAHAAASVPHGEPSRPHRVNPGSGAASHPRVVAPAPPGNAPVGAPQQMKRSLRMPMQPGSITLSATTASSFRGSDGRFEVQIPAGAISAQDLNQAGGSISLRVTQIAPPSGSNAGGSGQFSLGAYLLQLVDAHGRLLNHGLRQPVQVRYHLLPKEQALHLEHAYLLLNGGVADDALRIQGVVAPATGSTVVSTLGVQTARATALDPSAHVLSATVPLDTPSTSMSWDSDSPIATFGKPDPASVSLSAGALSYTQPIDIPAGPGDLTPPLQLVYSSEAVNEQHNASAAASWVGEGWNLSLGAITWAEHNVLAGCKNNCTANWENVWYLNDAYGTSSQLIPPNINVSTYYDDTANYYCATGNPNAYPCPILWHTADETHDKIYAYVALSTLASRRIRPASASGIPTASWRSMAVPPTRCSTITRPV